MKFSMVKPIERPIKSSEPDSDSEPHPALIPGLPDDIAEQCLLHLPFPYHTLARSVSVSWNRALSAPRSASSSHLFVFAFDRSSLRVRWHSLDPRTRRWFTLPPMPQLDSPLNTPLCPSAFATAAVSKHGELYVLGGMLADTQTPLKTVLCYRAATNSWTSAPPMPTARCFFAAGAVGERIIAAGGCGSSDTAVEVYESDKDTWRAGTGMERGMARYDAAVVGKKMFITEGWTWPFDTSPRGRVYDPETDSWEEMRAGMREGWTGASAVSGGALYVVAEYGDRRVKVYDERVDTWRPLIGGGVPTEVKRPHAVTGDGVEGTNIYVVGSGLDVGIGRVVKTEEKEERIEWEVVKGPPAFEEMAPCSALILYA